METAIKDDKIAPVVTWIIKKMKVYKASLQG